LNKEGIYQLEKVDLFNILCIPPFQNLDNDGGDIDTTGLLAPLANYCQERRAILLIDAPSNWTSSATASTALPDIVNIIGSDFAKNVALYFPRILKSDILNGGRIKTFTASGAIAGIFARTDTQRGVWKAPAGLEASIAGAAGVSILLTDGENGLLNPLAVNCLRTFPASGTVVWGARTLQGNDQLVSEWKYIPVRRTALYIEESLYRGLQWVVFEPNDEPLWAQIRLNVGAFMHNLFVKGAFQGQTPRDAYFVKCDKETTTQNDIDLGIVNIVVGFAPLKPAEFVIISLQQIAGQIQV
jgi:phage tail sheath protein FI